MRESNGEQGVDHRATGRQAGGCRHQPLYGLRTKVVRVEESPEGLGRFRSKSLWAQRPRCQCQAYRAFRQAAQPLPAE